MYTKAQLLAFAALLFIAPRAFAQTDAEVTSKIMQQDSLFWITYNTCDTAANRHFFEKEVEFYHDKSGVTHGVEALSAALKNNLCSNNNFRLRREPVSGSLQVFPMHNNGAVYGAIISGEHLFYISENGKPERLDGRARFTHLWLLKNGDWKMARILSYDHKPATSGNKRTAIKLPEAALQKWVGTYKGSNSGTVAVRAENENLILVVQNTSFTLHPEAPNRCFIEERDLTFELMKVEKGNPSKIQVRENGAPVEELVLVSKN
jgi:hypothetical protein